MMHNEILAWLVASLTRLAACLRAGQASTHPILAGLAPSLTRLVAGLKAST